MQKGASMLKDERLRRILEFLKKDGHLVASELAKRLEVSEDTVRRDLRDLAEDGRIERVHGGALSRSLPPLNYSERLLRSPDVKEKIARAVLPYIKKDMVVFLDSGTTTLQVARLLPADLKATIVTNGLPHALALVENPSVEIVMLGGIVNRSARATSGVETLSLISSIRADLCLLGVCSIDVAEGLSDDEFDETRVKAAMLERSAKRIALADPEKLGAVSPFRIAPLEGIDLLVTSKGVEAELLESFRRAGLELLLA
jgi:DeoR/GlpR family transcriptional regulator of sugar metabolism